jgi:hypothetical protein
MPNIKIAIPYTPPGTLGTFKGVHVYVEAPDQSSSPTARMDGVTDLSGSFVLQDDWAPVDLGKYRYVAVEQPLVVILPTGLNQRVEQYLRVYLAPYSDELDNTLVRYGSPGATPSVVVTVPARVAAKPGSGSNVTTFLVPSISASTSAPVSVSGKLRRPISVTVNLSGLPTLPNSWAYQLLGFLNGDTTTQPVLASGIITDVSGGLIPAGPDGISVAHTFGPEEPTSIISVTIFAVAGLIAPDHFVPGAAPHTPGVFSPNNIVPGITASAVVSYGTTTGVVDPTAAIQALLDTSVGTLAGVFGVLPQGIDNVRIALLAVDTAQLANLSATAAKLAAASVTSSKIDALAVGAAALGVGAVTTTKLAALAVDAAALAAGAVTTTKLAALAVDAAALATSSVTSTKIASAAVGTAAIANAAITNALIANLAVGTAAIQTGAITTALIANAAITSALVGTAAIGTAAIQTGAITTALIANAAITNALIANLAVGDAQISNLNVSKLLAGTISVAVSLTAPTITVTSAGFTINMDSTNGVKVTGNGIVAQMNAATIFGVANGLLVYTAAGSAWATQIDSGLIEISETISANDRIRISATASNSQLTMHYPSGAGGSIGVELQTGLGLRLRDSSGSVLHLLDSVGGASHTGVVSALSFTANGNVGWTGPVAGRSAIGGLVV